MSPDSCNSVFFYVTRCLRKPKAACMWEGVGRLRSIEPVLQQKALNSPEGWE